MVSIRADGLLTPNTSVSSRFGEKTPLSFTSLSVRKGAFVNARKTGAVLSDIPWSFRFCSLYVKERLAAPVNRFEN
jgi:hypothetical protein